MPVHAREHLKRKAKHSRNVFVKIANEFDGQKCNNVFPCVRLQKINLQQRASLANTDKFNWIDRKKPNPNNSELKNDLTARKDLYCSTTKFNLAWSPLICIRKIDLPHKSNHCNAADKLRPELVRQQPSTVINTRRSNSTWNPTIRIRKISFPSEAIVHTSSSESKTKQKGKGSDVLNIKKSTKEPITLKKPLVMLKRILTDTNVVYSGVKHNFNLPNAGSIKRQTRLLENKSFELQFNNKKILRRHNKKCKSTTLNLPVPQRQNFRNDRISRNKNIRTYKVIKREDGILPMPMKTDIEDRKQSNDSGVRLPVPIEIKQEFKSARLQPVVRMQRLKNQQDKNIVKLRQYRGVKHTNSNSHPMVRLSCSSGETLSLASYNLQSKDHNTLYNIDFNRKTASQIKLEKIDELNAFENLAKHSKDLFHKNTPLLISSSEAEKMEKCSFKSHRNIQIGTAFSRSPKVCLKRLKNPKVVAQELANAKLKESEYISLLPTSKIVSGETKSLKDLEDLEIGDKKLLAEILAERTLINFYLTQNGYSPAQFRFHNTIDDLQVFLDYMLAK